MSGVAPVVFVDTETTGLDPKRHEVWEVGLIEADGTEHSWFVKPRNLRSAQPDALRITRYYERVNATIWTAESTVAWEVVRLTAGRHLVASVPSFDAAFLGAFLDSWGYVPAWHYHLVDTEALVAGKLGVEPPWDSADLSRAIGVQPPAGEDAHTALADARWAKALYDAVTT